MRRMSPNFELAMGFLTALAVVVYICYCIVTAAHGWAIQRDAMEVLAPIPQHKLGPDVSHCMRDDNPQPLWDCIRHVEND